MWVGGGTGRFLLHLMENYTKMVHFGGEAEQAALGGHHAVCAGLQTVITKSLVPSHHGSIIPRHSSYIALKVTLKFTPQYLHPSMCPLGDTSHSLFMFKLAM